MADQQRAPTSKLLELIKTGSLPQDKQDISDVRGSVPGEKPTEAAPVPAQPAKEIEKRDNITISSAFYKVPNIVDDHIVAGLSMTEEVIYRHMIRLSWGWNKNWCRVGTNYFLQKSSLKSRKSVKDAISRLLGRKLIMYHVVEDRIDRNQDGTVYIVPLPRKIGILQPSTLQGSIPDKGMENGGSGQGILGNSTLLHSVLPNGVLDSSTPGVLSDSILQNSIPEQKPHDSPIQGSILRNSILPDSLITNNITDSLKDTLSPRDIISGFYKGIGQEKISKTKRERAEKSFKELQRDGFSLEDIQFAVEWILKNSKEEPYDFSIITHTIGQAMAAKEKVEREKTERLERERIALEEEAEKERQDREREKIEAYKETLSADEREKLRERALEEIRKIDGVKEEFIGDILIEVKENEILKAEMGK